VTTVRSEQNRSQSGLDRDSYEPAYAQVVRILSDEIARGRYRPGDQLPSESQLCARFDVSPMTIRRAMNIMVDRGTVTASQGKGVFVRGLDMREASFRLLERNTAGFAAAGAERQVRLLQAAIVPSDERVARKLDIAAASKVVYLRRLVSGDGDPIMYHREYLVYNPRRPFVEAELQITSLEGLFRGQNGQGLRRGDLNIEAVVLTPEEAEILQAPVGLPAFCLEHVFYDFENHPVAWGWFICRADRYTLTGRIGAGAS
jgi:DNA-binding GntR family transcriptional regulator